MPIWIVLEPKGHMETYEENPIAAFSTRKGAEEFCRYRNELESIDAKSYKIKIVPFDTEGTE